MMQLSPVTMKLAAVSAATGALFLVKSKMGRSKENETKAALLAIGLGLAAGAYIAKVR